MRLLGNWNINHLNTHKVWLTTALPCVQWTPTRHSLHDRGLHERAAPRRQENPSGRSRWFLHPPLIQGRWVQEPHCRSQQAHLAIVFGYFYPSHWVRTVRTVHQGTDEQVLIGQEPWELLLTRHLVDTTTALVSHHSLVGSVEICRTKDLLEKVFLVEWYFHDVVFTHPHKGLHSPHTIRFPTYFFGGSH